VCQRRRPHTTPILTCTFADDPKRSKAALERWELVIFPDSLIARPRRGGGPGDQARQQRDRRFYLGAGKLADQIRQWRRNLFRQQTELDRLHGRPPRKLTSVQPAPGHLRCGCQAPKPAHTGLAGPPPIPAWPGRHQPGRRLPGPDRSTTPGPAAWTRPAASPAAHALRAGASRPAPEAPAQPADDARA